MLDDMFEDEPSLRRRFKTTATKILKRTDQTDIDPIKIEVGDNDE